MPFYEYDCAECGTFSCLRPMAECAQPAECPDCGAVSPRLVSAPHIRGARAALRLSLEERNERSAYEPKVVRHFGRKNQDLEDHGHTRHRNRLSAHNHKHQGHAHHERPWMVGH